MARKRDGKGDKKQRARRLINPDDRKRNYRHPWTDEETQCLIRAISIHGSD